VTEQPPPADPDSPEAADGPDVERIARLRAGVGQPAATEPAATEPAATEPAATEPAATQAVATQPVATQPVAAEPGRPAFWTPGPAATQAPQVEPAVAEPAVAAPPPATEPRAAAVTSAGPALGAPEPATRPTGRRGRVARLGSRAVPAVVVLAVVAAVTVALAGWVVSRVSSVNAVDGTRADVVGAATSGVATVLSYDYRHLDTDFAHAQGLLTAKFRKQYDDTTAKGVRPLAAKYKAISSADVSAAGVVEAGRDRAVVLVFVNQTVTNSQLTAPRLDRSRIKVSLVRSNGRWLIDKLTTL
jgi:Mce-associated membrane protein